MKRIAIGAAVVALSAAGLVATAGAANAGPGQDMKECFGTNYGQSALKFSDTKGAHPGGNIGPTGSPSSWRRTGRTAPRRCARRSVRGPGKRRGAGPSAPPLTLAPPSGLEPETLRLTVECSAN